MNIKEIIAAVATKTGQSQKQVRETYDALTEVVQEALTNEATDKLALVNLITFYKTDKEAAVKRNPATGEPVDVPAYTRLTAKPVKSLKDAVR